MSLGVLNNIAAIYAENNLNQTQSSLQTTLNQLSSGSRINSGADDAAGLSVVDGLGANVAALTQSAQNASDGIGLLQTADGALSQVTNLLNRAVTLATEAANGTLNSNQVTSANQEYQNILTEIANIGSTTNFNENQVFTSKGQTVFVSDGTSSGANSYSETIGTLTLASVGVTAASPAVTSLISNPATGTGSTATAGASVQFGSLSNTTNTLSGTLSASVAGATAVTFSITAGDTLAQTVAAINATGSSFKAAGIVASTNNGGLVLTGPVDTGTAGTNTLNVTGSTLSQTTIATTTATPGVNLLAGATDDVSQLTQLTAQSVLTSVTTAINDVAVQRGNIGADVNELTAASNVASAESVNLTAAQSTIQSTDYGAATSNLAKYQVLSQTGISALAQANSVQQEVLKLLQT